MMTPVNVQRDGTRSTRQTPRLERVLIAPARGVAMRDVASVQAVAGRGLVGDRYHAGRGTFSARAAVAPGAREVSIIDAAAVATCAQRLNMPVDAALLRRNLVTSGLELKTLRGRVLAIGAVRLEIVSSCPPCGYLSRLCAHDMRLGLRGLGGMRARILTGGHLDAGAAMQIEA